MAGIIAYRRQRVEEWQVADPERDCDFLVDALPAGGGDARSGWARLHCTPFLDAGRSSALGRLLPPLPLTERLPGVRRAWVDYCLLGRLS